MSDHYSNIPSYKSISNTDNLDSYEAYYEELQAKSHNLACCFGRMVHNNPNHSEIALWKEKSKFWHEYHARLRYMEAPIENAFKVFEAIGSFAAEYKLYTELEMELINPRLCIRNRNES
jgi:hypothetical protein